MPARRQALLGVLLVVALVGGCSKPGVSRRAVVDRYRNALVAEGVREPQAECLTERFFADLTDAELKAFQGRDRLTDAEKRRFAELADECGDAG